jgi:hypothetical protein
MAINPSLILSWAAIFRAKSSLLVWLITCVLLRPAHRTVAFSKRCALFDSDAVKR